VIKLSWTINYSGLEAKVSVAKRYYEYYYNRVVYNKVLIIAKCINIVRYSSAIIAKVLIFLI
jgi:hypothetical protein